MNSNKSAVGWVTAHVGLIFEDGLQARRDNPDDYREVPVELVWCEPHNGGSFVIRFSGQNEEGTIYARVKAELVDEDGNLV